MALTNKMDGDMSGDDKDDQNAGAGVSMHSSCATNTSRRAGITWGQNGHPSCTTAGRASSPGAPSTEEGEQQRKELKAIFNGGPEKLPYFLVQVGFYMKMMMEVFEFNTEQVYEVGALLEGKAAAWLVRLFEEQAPELQDFNQFKTA
uniref:Uncharacterized protein n=1 Tax=Sphaerodactylus townsendi TaxID=933632 RepID=A0ACB8EH85_9SAUR